MGTRRRVRQTGKGPLSLEQLNYWSNKACKDSWEKVNAEQKAREHEREANGAAYWMAVLSGEVPDDAEGLETPPYGA